MSEFNFKSQPATSIEQSERLIALGLRKETADMKYVGLCRNEDGSILFTKIPICKGVITENNIDLPAWSLHRLWELLDKIKKYEGEDELLFPRISLVDGDVIFESPKSIWARRNFCSPKGVYENIINCFEELIKEGYFPKEYLV